MSDDKTNIFFYTVFPRIDSDLEYFSPLNSFRTLVTVHKAKYKKELMHVERRPFSTQIQCQTHVSSLSMFSIDQPLLTANSEAVLV